MDETRMVTEPDDLEKALKMDRTDEQVRDREPVTVTFGAGDDAREFDIVPAVRRDARKFRARIQDFRDTVNSLIHMVSAAMDTEGRKNIQLTELFRLAFTIIGGRLDDAIDLIYLYCPTLAADKDWIEEHGTDEQFQHALFTVIKVAFGPFVRLLALSSANLGLALPLGLNGDQKEPIPPTPSTEPPEDGSVNLDSGTDSQTKSTPISLTNSTT